MNPPTPPPPINPLNQTSVSPPPKKFKKAFWIVVLVIVVGIGGFLSYSLMIARASSRDARRQADLMQIKSALYLYFNDRQTYPASLAELTKPYKGQSYMGAVPVAPKPADGPCTNAQNTYSYAKIGSDDYKLTYCIGKGGQLKNIFTGQIKTITPGVQTIRASSR